MSLLAICRDRDAPFDPNMARQSNIDRLRRGEKEGA